MHFIDGDCKKKYLMLHGLEVCALAWYLIDGIPKLIFHSYVQRYNKEVFCCVVTPKPKKTQNSPLNQLKTI